MRQEQSARSKQMGVNVTLHQLTEWPATALALRMPLVIAFKYSQSFISELCLSCLHLPHLLMDFSS